MNDGIVTLSEGRLYALANPYALGRVSTHPVDATGFAPMNVYVLVEGADVLIVDTGWSIHEPAILEQLRAVLPRHARLSIFLTRAGEFNSICNVRSIAEHFDVHTLCGVYPDLTTWVDFRPERSPYGSWDVGPLEGVEGQQLRFGDVITIGADRRITLLEPPLKLLPTCWLYDEGTRTLFTSDAFTHVWSASSDGPWTVTTTVSSEPDGLYAYLTGSRYWWLAEARTSSIAQELDDVFGAYQVDVIAPGFGCMFVGTDAVRAQRDALGDLLATVGEATR